jgi:hypothetical protein
MAAVFSRLSAGLAAIVLHPAEMKLLEVAHSRLIRAIVANCRGVSLRGWTHEEALRTARIATVQSHVQTMRLRFLQCMMRNPRDHVAALAAIAGHTRNTRPQLRSDGWPAPGASAYLEQYWGDVVAWARDHPDRWASLASGWKGLPQNALFLQDVLVGPVEFCPRHLAEYNRTGASAQ